MINWINPKETLPEEGEMVWVCSFHKENFIPDSVEINAGEVQWSNDKKQCSVFNNDAIGSGSLRWILWESDDYEFRNGSSERKDAWVKMEDINPPKWYPK